MTKTKKTILFFFLVFFFLFSSFGLIFYSQGYRFDFKTKKIVQTGGLFIKTNPAGAEIYLNNKFVKKTNFLFDSLFLGNLLPGNYQIRIEKKGYHPWRKTLQIKETRVTEVKHVILFPQKIDFQHLESQIKKVFFWEKERKFFLLRQTPTRWELIAFGLPQQKEILFSQPLPSSQLKNSDLQFELKNLEKIFLSPNSKKALFEIKEQKEKKYFLFDLKTKETKEISSENLTIKKILFDSKNPQKLYLLAKEEDSSFKFFVWENETFSPLTIELAPGIHPLDFEIQNGDLIWFSKEGFVLRGRIENNHLISIKEVLNIKPIKVQKEKKYTLKIIANNLFLFEGEKLLWLHPSFHLFIPILEIVKDLSLSPDNKKIALSTGNQVWLFYLRDDYQQPKRRVLDKFLLTTTEDPINKIVWLNPYYLFVAFEKGIKIVEIDNRFNVNEVLISEFKNPEIFWLKQGLFAFSQGNFFFTQDILK